MRRVLVIADDPSDLSLIQQDIGPDFLVTPSSGLGDAVARLREARFDAVVLAMGKSDAEAGGALLGVRAAVGETPLVVVASAQSEADDDALAFACLSAGVGGFLGRRELKGERLRRALELALSRRSGPSGGAKLDLGASEDAPPKAPAEAAGPSGTRRLRVLLVDDDETVRRVVSRMLQSRYHVTAVAGGADALKVLEQDARYDIVFCDVAMGDMDGPTLAQALQKAHSNLSNKVVLLSGGPVDETTRLAMEQTGLRVLFKPCSIAELCEVVELIAAQ